VTPYYDDGQITIFHADCRDVLPELPRNLAVVSDPPYGMNYNTDSRRFAGGANGAKRYGQGSAERPIAGDQEPFDPSPFLDFPSVLMWGYNHWAQRVPVGTVLVWLKKREHRFGTFLSDAEVAWMKGGHGVYAKYFPGDGRWDLAEGTGRVHPAQKPIALMSWCITKSAADDAVILDPFMGSGTTLRAAKDLGRKAIGIELEERYCERAVMRLQQAVLPFDLTA
jgi:site-specific DNA-methyltransferase (adenine-specific)